ncbi:MAG: 16S rRNA (cytidine(1402)-2'-O)-methyltransferase, partial [Pseudomonadota bacterium]
LKALAGADRIACEDTRVTAKLLNRYGIKKPMIAYHEHNMRERGERLLSYIKNGEAIALVSDAGTPLLSDPGAELVQAAVAAGLSVTPYPGASALLSALVAAGLPAAQFHFMGFLPPKQTARRKALSEAAAIPGALVFYETAPRLGDCLTDMADILGLRDAAVCRELTKLHETIVRDDLATLAAKFAAEKTKGEIVIVIGAAKENAVQVDIVPLLQTALKKSSLKEAVADVTKKTGLPRRDVYAEALRLKDKS